MGRDQGMIERMTGAAGSDALAPLLVIGLLAVIALSFRLAARRGGAPRPVASPVRSSAAPGTVVCSWAAERDRNGMLLRWRCGTCNDTAVSDAPPHAENCRLKIDACA